jgi:cytosine deaminase
MDKNFDLIITNALLNEYQEAVHIAVKNGRISELVNPNDVDTEVSRSLLAEKIYDANHQFVCSGFYESHIHLDKACILDRCTIEEGTLDEAVAETGKAKKEFTEKDVFTRASYVIEKAIKKGTMGLRTFVETDSKTELRSFEAIKKVREKYAFAIDIEICAFAQEGLTQEMKTHKLLDEALQNGANLVGGCPYKDEDPEKHIEMIFDLAQKHNVNVDFHLDFDLDPNHSSIPKVVEETIKRNYQGRVSIGHVTKLTAMSREQRKTMAQLLNEGGITLTVLPATDIFLNGRNEDSLTPRGMVNANELNKHRVSTTISSNNILNAFTPFGDASLVRMANLYANVTQLSKDQAIEEVFDMITKNAAQLLSMQVTIESGAPANFVVLEAKSAIDVIREIAQPLAGFKNGKQTFSNKKAKIYF